jgi:Protein of unknown function (DUF3108)
MIRKFFKISFLTLLLLTISAFAVFAQNGSVDPAGSPSFFSGETLKFDGKLNKIFHGIPVAELTFNAIGGRGSNALIIKSEAVSRGTLMKLVGYSFLQQYESTLDDKFRIVKTVKHDVQKERVRDNIAEFDYTQKRVTFVETDPKDPTRPPRRIASEIGNPMLDMISAIYYSRMLPLEVEKRYELSVSDSGLVYKVPFAVTGREIQKTILGKVMCLIVEPEIFGTGRLIEQKGSMTIWMTADARHVPVRAVVRSEYGKIDIKLKSYTK